MRKMKNEETMVEARGVKTFGSNLEFLASVIDYLRLLAQYRCQTYGRRENKREAETCVQRRKISQKRIQTVLQTLERRTVATLAEGCVTLPLEQLAKEHSLVPFEKWVLAVLVGLGMDDQFCMVMDELVGRRGNREVGAVLALLCENVEQKIESRRFFISRATLFAHGMLSIGFGRSLMSESEFMRMDLEVPRRIASLILGEYDVDDQLLAFSSVIEPEATLEQVVLPSGVKEDVLNMVRDRDEYLRCRKEWGFDDVIGYGRGTVLLFSGPPGTGKTMMAHALAKATGSRLMLVDIRKVINYSKSDFEENLVRIFHEARLQKAFLFFDEADEMFGDRAFNGAMPILLRELERLDGICILATNRRQVLDEALDRRVLYKLDFEVPPAELRAEIWRRLLPAQAPVAKDVDCAALGETFEFSGGYIKNAVQNAMIAALWRKGDERVITHRDLWQAAVRQRNNRLSNHADKVTPKVTLEDVILDEVTRERVAAFVQAARRRSTVFGSWGFGKKATYGKGLSALFSGPSGTGKTLTAEAVAGELGQVLYPVRMDTIVSKYVGETEKNLAQIFAAARESDAVILFDEADAIFGKRLDEGGHHAHYINQQINVLLSQLERFDGLVLLATNRAESFDEAFERRIRFHIRFNMPDVRARAAIWRRLLPAEAPVDEDVDFDALAMKFEFTGGTIKSVLLRAAFDAASYGERLSQELLFKSARSECPFAPKRTAVGF